MNFPGDVVESHARIRIVLFVSFYKWFGRVPNRYWHSDGFMAEALDKRGNRIELIQVNHGDPGQPVLCAGCGREIPAEQFDHPESSLCHTCEEKIGKGKVSWPDAVKKK